MKILVIDPDYTRGGAERIVWATNAHTEHEARGLFRRSEPPSRYAGSMLLPPAWSLARRRDVRAATDWADVLHFVHAASPRSIGRPGLIGRRPMVWQMFTQWDPTARRAKWYERLWLERDLRGVRRAVVAEGWQRYPLWRGKRFSLLPAVFPIDQPEFMPLPVAERRRAVSYAVMHTGGGVAPKGYGETVEALRGLPQDVMHKVPFLECMRRRGLSRCGVDEVVTPVVHFSAFEYLSRGVPCVSWWDELTENTVKEATGCEHLPLTNANIESLRSVVSILLDLPQEALEDLSAKLRGWMERYMHPRKTIKRYVELWESCTC